MPYTATVMYMYICTTLLLHDWQIVYHQHCSQEKFLVLLCTKGPLTSMENTRRERVKERSIELVWTWHDAIIMTSWYHMDTTVGGEGNQERWLSLVTCSVRYLLVTRAPLGHVHWHQIPPTTSPPPSQWWGAMRSREEQDGVFQGHLIYSYQTQHWCLQTSYRMTELKAVTHSHW